MKQYLSLLNEILTKGTLIPNRTGISAYTLPHMMLQHSMQDGFPLLTTRKMAFKTLKVELEGFLNGVTDKRWYNERGCKIWNEWCNPKKIPIGLSDADRKQFQLQEPDLGYIYGYQWRNFNHAGLDQLKSVVDTLKNNKYDRRMLCLSWNPLALAEQALPACHILWHVTVVEDTLNLCWFQRSVDFVLGLPTNTASYALLLHLLCKESGLKEGTLTGFLSNCHIYENHVDGVKEQLTRKPHLLPTIETSNFTSIYNWKHQDTSLVDYQCHDKISFEIAV